MTLRTLLKSLLSFILTLGAIALKQGVLYHSSSWRTRKCLGRNCVQDFNGLKMLWQSRAGDPWADVRSSEVPLGSPCPGNRTPRSVRGERQGMSTRALRERNSTISHSSLKRPSCGILLCHGMEEFVPFVPIVVPSWKNLSSGSLRTNVNRGVRAAIQEQTRALCSSALCLWWCPTSGLQGRFKKPCKKSSYLITFSRDKFFWKCDL